MPEYNIQTRTGIKYLYLEMIQCKNNNYDVISGLFAGIRKKKGQKFILIHSLGNATSILNLAYYKVLSIEQLIGENKNFVFLTREDSDQEKALGMIEVTYDVLKLRGFGTASDPEIIDVSKYQEVPEEYKRVATVSRDNFQASYQEAMTKYDKDCRKKYGFNNRYSRTNYNRKPVEIVAAPINRGKSKKLTPAQLQQLSTIIDSVNTGSYTATIPQVEDDEEETGSPVAGAYRDDDLDARHMYGWYGQ